MFFGASSASGTVLSLRSPGLIGAASTNDTGSLPGKNDPANDWKPAVTGGYEIHIDNTGFNPDTNTFDNPLHKTGAIYTLAPSTAVMPAVDQSVSHIGTAGQQSISGMLLRPAHGVITHQIADSTPIDM